MSIDLRFVQHHVNEDGDKIMLNIFVGEALALFLLSKKMRTRPSNVERTHCVRTKLPLLYSVNKLDTGLPHSRQTGMLMKIQGKTKENDCDSQVCF